MLVLSYSTNFVLFVIFLTDEEEEENVDVEGEEDVGLEALVHSAETAGEAKTEVLLQLIMIYRWMLFKVSCVIQLPSSLVECHIQGWTLTFLV